ncbi:helix-turn-helix transcriptional regulator [Nocardioides sp. P86]|uniref:ArsR/SmtB family transcription factor n=1 Tax=Nocardioides sp. P86 TaxID=2939569 RepID=UPI002041A11E|nr:hypothetical protein [Nocardioides sp. P86]MCM3515150.1 hypothetical protein [Nocardioides sp. P86]
MTVVPHGLPTPGRLSTLTALQVGPLSVGEILVALDLKRLAISYPLKHLRRLGPILADRHGRRVTHRDCEVHVLDSSRAASTTPSTSDWQRETPA